MKICGHTVVKNEARFLWFSVLSVIDHLDKLLLWDTGSTDGTLEIIEKLRERYPDKILFKQRKQETVEDFANVRQEMLDETDSDWILMLDADEIWWKESIKRVVDLIQNKGNELESIIVPTILPVGDMFHRQEEKAGRYKLAGHVGHYSLRAVNMSIPGLHSFGKHGVWGWVDEEGKMIQNRDLKKIGYVNAPILHTTHLKRAGQGKDTDVVKRKMKLKHEIGKLFPGDFYYPQVFFRGRPGIIESPWGVMDFGFKLVSYLETPLRKIKRRLWWGRAGY